MVRTQSCLSFSLPEYRGFIFSKVWQIQSMSLVQVGQHLYVALLHVLVYV